MFKFISCCIYFGALVGIYYQFLYPSQPTHNSLEIENQQNILVQDTAPYRGGMAVELKDLNINLFEWPSPTHVIKKNTFNSEAADILQTISLQKFFYVIGGFLLGLMATIIIRFRIIKDVNELVKSKESLDYELWKTKNDAIKKERILKRQVIDLELKIAELQSSKVVSTVEQNTAFSSK